MEAKSMQTARGVREVREEEKTNGGVVKAVIDDV
jgi:hypothetical protein